MLHLKYEICGCSEQYFVSALNLFKVEKELNQRQNSIST